MNFLRTLFARAPRPKARVLFDAERIALEHADGRTESLAWGDLQQIDLLLSHNGGPWDEQVTWLLAGASGQRCAIPNRSEGMQELLPRLQELPGFQTKAVLKALFRTENATILCWKKA